MHKNKAVSITIVLCGMLFMVLGMYLGQHKEVLQKAIMICLECIGIG